MQFNSGTNSIADEARFLAKASATDLPISDLTRLANQALDRMNSLVLGVETSLQFDDSNYGDQPVGTFAFSAGQNSYSIQNDQLGNAILGITKIIMPNGSGGGSSILAQFGTDDSTGTAFLNQYTTSGTPTGFTQVGSNVYLYPTPSYSGTATIYFRRNVKYFLTTDTTVSPGFAAPFHRLIPLWIAYWWNVREGKSRSASQLMNEINLLEDEFVEYYSDGRSGQLTGAYTDPR